MISTYRYKDAVWLDLNHPTEEDINHVIDIYKIDRPVARELLIPTNKPYIEFHEHFTYLVLRFPAFKHSHTSERSDQEIDFIIGKNVVITARFDNIDALHTFSKILETESVLDKKEIPNPADFIFLRMLRELYDAAFNELAYIDSWTSEIENNVFKGKEKEMVRSLSLVGRVLIDFKRTLFQHEEILASLREHGGRAHGEYFSFHMRSILGDYDKLKHTIESQREIISELRETNNSLLNTEQSEVAKVVTVLAFIAVPISLVIGIFQIDSVSRPIIGMENDFWILTVSVLFIGIFLFAFFRHQKWL